METVKKMKLTARGWGWVILCGSFIWFAYLLFILKGEIFFALGLLIVSFFGILGVINILEDIFRNIIRWMLGYKKEQVIDLPGDFSVSGIVEALHKLGNNQLSISTLPYGNGVSVKDVSEERIHFLIWDKINIRYCINVPEALNQDKCYGRKFSQVTVMFF
mgnify:CR=1 FL=1